MRAARLLEAEVAAPLAQTDRLQLHTQCDQLNSDQFARAETAGSPITSGNIVLEIDWTEYLVGWRPAGAVGHMRKVSENF